MRESMIIYRSFYEAIREIPKKNQAEVWNAIFEFSLNFNEVELKGISKTIFSLIKPQLTANITKYKNGSKPKLNGSETEADDKQDESKTEGNVNVNVNDNVRVNGKGKKFTPPSLSDVEAYFSENGYKNGKRAFEYYQNLDWHDSNGNKVKNWKSKMQSVWFKDENKAKPEMLKLRNPLTEIVYMTREKFEAHPNKKSYTILAND